MAQLVDVGRRDRISSSNGSAAMLIFIKYRAANSVPAARLLL